MPSTRWFFPLKETEERGHGCREKLQLGPGCTVRHARTNDHEYRSTKPSTAAKRTDDAIELCLTKRHTSSREELLGSS